MNRPMIIFIIILIMMIFVAIITWLRSPILEKEGIPVYVYTQSHRWFQNPDQIIIEWKDGDISAYPVMRRAHLIKTGEKIKIYHYYHGLTHHYEWEYCSFSSAKKNN